MAKVQITTGQFDVTFDHVGETQAREIARSLMGEPINPVRVVDSPSQKIQAIKKIRNVSGLGLKDAKDLVDGTEEFRGVSGLSVTEFVSIINDHGGEVEVL